MALGFGKRAPASRQPLVKTLSSMAFIGLPCPMNNTGIGIGLSKPEPGRSIPGDMRSILHPLPGKYIRQHAARYEPASLRTQECHSLGDVLRGDVSARCPTVLVVAERNGGFQVGQGGNRTGTHDIHGHPVRPRLIMGKQKRVISSRFAGIARIRG